MVQRSQGPRLALELAQAIGVAGDVLRQDLDGDGAIEAGVAGAVDLAHAPGADQAEDFVWTQARASSQRHGRFRPAL